MGTPEPQQQSELREFFERERGRGRAGGEEEERRENKLEEEKEKEPGGSRVLAQKRIHFGYSMCIWIFESVSVRAWERCSLCSDPFWSTTRDAFAGLEWVAAARRWG